MSPELFWMAAVAVLTALLWAPYILYVIVSAGPVQALTGRVGDEVSGAAWAQRAQRAHLNAVENLVVFAPLAIAVHVTELGTALTATAAMVYFWARAAHYVVYVLSIPVIRTLLFAAGVASQLILGYTLLTA